MPDRILVVEDDPNDAELLMLALEAQRLTNHIHIVRDGAEALDYLHCRGEYADRMLVNPSLVLLDIKLPKIDGIEVLKNIRSTPSLFDLRVMMLTSSREERDVMRSYALGIDAYVIKTPDFRDLISAIFKLADLHRLQRERSSERL